MFANYQLAFKDSIHLYSQVDQKFMLRWMEANVLVAYGGPHRSPFLCGIPE